MRLVTRDARCGCAFGQRPAIPRSNTLKHDPPAAPRHVAQEVDFEVEQLVMDDEQNELERERYDLLTSSMNLHWVNE